MTPSEQAAYERGVADERERCLGICNSMNSPYANAGTGRQMAYLIEEKIRNPQPVQALSEIDTNGKD